MNHRFKIQCDFIDFFQWRSLWRTKPDLNGFARVHPPWITEKSTFRKHIAHISDGAEERQRQYVPQFVADVEEMTRESEPRHIPNLGRFLVSENPDQGIGNEDQTHDHR